MAKDNDNNKDIYYNEFFEGYPKLSQADLKTWIEENKRKSRKTFVEHPSVRNLTVRDIVGELEWRDRAKFYFLPFLVNCYRFTRQHRLPHFAIPVSPTCMFYRDRLHLRNFMDTVHQAFFRALEMCLPKGESIMLLVEKRFHVDDPIDGGTQQLYNMMWDVDLSAIVDDVRVYEPQKVILPKRTGNVSSRLPVQEDEHIVHQSDTYWNWPDLNPGAPKDTGVDLCRRTLWLMDDLHFLGKKYDLIGQEEYPEIQEEYPEIIDLSKYPEEKWGIYRKTARTFCFKVFAPKDIEDEDQEIISSDSDLEPDDDDMELDSTELEMLDSTLDFEKDDEDMNKILAFFANIPKVTGLVQGMLDMVGVLTRILPLVIDKIDDPKLKDALARTNGILGKGLEIVLKICSFLGIKVQKKPNPAVGWMVKNRFKKNKPDFLDFEISELNKTLDELEKVD